jgi:aspartyl-tRNA(Asn)/glutamyl-tRNA(Gln) amidotransferase subunit B
MSASVAVDLEPVIGLEIHVQLRTRRKMFCGCPNLYGAPPNTLVCPVCLGLPGALPVPNGQAVTLAVRAALGLDCQVHLRSVFARKNYFYPDLPKGYQITQYDCPLATDGVLDLWPPPERWPARVRIRRLHLEEDAGKSLHDRVPGATAVDLNRAGVPLIEIVTEPDLVAPEHARLFLTRLKQTLEFLGVSDCDMEKGSLRVDANVSLRPQGATTLGVKTELKNLNSFGFLEKALHAEIARQKAALAAGQPVVHETLLWDAARQQVRPMRSKEESHDYRYFPEPDLPPLLLEPAWIAEQRATLPERPAARWRRFQEQYGLPPQHADVLTLDRATADYFEAVVTAGAPPAEAASWIMGEVLAWTREHALDVGSFPMPATQLAELAALVRQGVLSRALARQVFERALREGRSPRSIVEAEGLAQVQEEGALAAWVHEVLAAHPQEVARYRAGETKLLGWFVGQVMRRSQGKADPKRTQTLLRQALEAAGSTS